MAHGSCKKFGCGCPYYTKSLLTPGLCKSCNHLKDQHNQFMPMEDHDEFPEDDGTSLTSSMAMTASMDYVSDEDEHLHRKSKSLKPRIDNYSSQILKKKEDLSHVTESMWKNKYFESQKEVEHWQTKYNNLYVKYKELLHKMEQDAKGGGKENTESKPRNSGINHSANTHSANTHSANTHSANSHSANTTNSIPKIQQSHHEPIDLLSGNHNDFDDGNGDINGVTDTFANWTTFQ